MKITSGLFLIGLSLNQISFAEGPSDSVVLARGTYREEKADITAICFSRDENKKCTDLQLLSLAGYKVEFTSSADVYNKLEFLKKHEYSSVSSPVHPWLNIADATFDSQPGDSVYKYFDYVLLGPFDVLLAPAELAAYGVTELSITVRIRRSISILVNFVEGKVSKRTAPKFISNDTFRSIIEDVFGLG